MKSLVTSAGAAILFAILGGIGSAQDQNQAPKLRVTGAIEFTGNKVFDQETLRRQLRLIRPGQPYDSAKLQYDIDRNLTAFLKQNGYITSEVSWEERALPDGSVGVRINVREGLQYRLSKLEIKGAKAFPAQELTAQFHLRQGDVLNFAEVKEGLERIQKMYSDQGYVDCSYIPEQQIDGARQTADLAFTIEEGLRYKIAYVGVVGCGEQAEEDRVRALIGLKPGEFFSQSALDAGVAALNKSGLFQKITESDVLVTPLDEKPGLLSVICYLKPKTNP